MDDWQKELGKCLARPSPFRWQTREEWHVQQIDVFCSIARMELVLLRHKAMREINEQLNTATLALALATRNAGLRVIPRTRGNRIVLSWPK